jgi:O-antigen/teichoic acid export membrane protein
LSQSVLILVLVDVLLSVVTLVTVPYLFHGLGDERYGILGLVTVLTAQVAPLHFGIAPATTRRVAERRGAGNGVGATALAALVLSVGSAVLAGGLSLVLAPLAWRAGFRLSPRATQEALEAVPLMAFVILLQPFIGNGMAVLAGREDFGRMGGIRVVHGVSRQGLAVGAVVLGVGLRGALTAFLVADSVTAVVLWWVVRVLPGRTSLESLRRELRRLTALGAPTALGSVFSTVLADLEKLAIGVVKSVGEFAYYETPANALVRITVIPAAIAGVIMPRVAAMGASASWHEEVARLVSLATRLSLAVIVCLGLPLSALLPELLSLWLGELFAVRSAPLARVILVGVVFQVAAFATHAVLRALASPKVLAILYAAELGVHCVLVYAFVTRWGITGAALAYTLRCLLDATAQRWLAERVLKVRSRETTQVLLTNAVTVVFTIVLLTANVTWPLRLILGMGVATLLVGNLVSLSELLSLARSLLRGLGPAPQAEVASGTR